MPIEKTDTPRRRLTVSREPEGVKAPGEPGSKGDLATKDAVIVIAACWAIVIALAWSLRKFNV